MRPAPQSLCQSRSTPSQRHKYMKRIDETGNRYGKWLVIGYSGDSFWLCRCECGKEAKIKGYHLRAENTSSCIKCRSGFGRLAYGESSRNELWTRYRYGARQRNIEWDLSKDDFFVLISQTCQYCGIEPSSSSHFGRRYGPCVYNGIDRIDNNFGYVSGNVVAACRICNQAKHTLTLDEFETWIDRLIEHRTPKEPWQE